MKQIVRSRLQSIGSTYYDGAKAEDVRSQSWLAWPQTAEKEFTYWNRLQLLKKKRALEANLGFVKAMIGKVGRYAVGKGLFPIPQTSDHNWNELAARKFDEWASNPLVCDSSGMMTYWEMQRWASKTHFGEGEAFVGLVNSSRVGAPQLQLFDNGEVENRRSNGASLTFLQPGETTYWDGVKLNRTGKILAYCIRTSDGGDYQDVQAQNMIHVCQRERPNQYRGITPFHASENSAIDVMDLKGLEIASAKLHSALALVYTKEGGQGIGAQGLFGALSAVAQGTPTSNGVGTGLNGTFSSTQAPTGGIQSNKEQMLETVYSGGGIVHLKNGEDIKLLTSNRASANLIEFMQWLFRDISTSTGLPVEMIWNMSELGGANSRIILADAQWFFDHIQDIINDQLNFRVWRWVIGSWIADGELPMPSDTQWWRVAWQGPPKLTADSGRAIMGDIAALDAGLGNLQDFYRARGGDWKPKTTQRILEVKYAMDECARLGIPYDKVYPQKAGAPAASMGSSGGGGANSSDPGGGVQA